MEVLREHKISDAFSAKSTINKKSCCHTRNCHRCWSHVILRSFIGMSIFSFFHFPVHLISEHAQFQCEPRAVDPAFSWKFCSAFSHNSDDGFYPSNLLHHRRTGVSRRSQRASSAPDTQMITVVEMFLFKQRQQ